MIDRPNSDALHVCMYVLHSHPNLGKGSAAISNDHFQVSYSIPVQVRFSSPFYYHPTLTLTLT